MHPSLIAAITDQRGVFTRTQAFGCGYSADEVRRLVRRREWAALASLGCEPVLSHRSAAVAWGLPLLGPLPDDVALTTSSQNRRRTTGLELHTARTPKMHRAVTDGLAVTSAARTVSDLARSQSFAAATVAADAALHRGLCTGDDVVRVIQDCAVWRGIVRTKRVIAFADGLSESPGESLSRVVMAEHRLPVPVLQGELVLEGTVVRVDFLWPGLGVVGEFDGRLKYTDASDLWREKQREDLIRRAGYAVVRWVWADVYPDPARFVRRLRGALAGAR